MKPGIDYIGVGCGPLIVNEKGETLLLKRGPGSKNDAGVWNKPGGTVEFSESIEDAIKRETKEEVGVDIEIIGYLRHTDQRLPKEGQHWVAINCVARIIAGVPKIMEPDKISELRWFPLDAPPSPLAQTTSEAIAEYLKNHLPSR
jgi:8-oxo-dGTP diphosphatase